MSLSQLLTPCARKPRNTLPSSTTSSSYSRRTWSSSTTASSTCCASLASLPCHVAAPSSSASAARASNHSLALLRTYPPRCSSKSRSRAHTMPLTCWRTSSRSTGVRACKASRSAFCSRTRRSRMRASLSMSTSSLILASCPTCSPAMSWMPSSARWVPCTTQCTRARSPRRISCGICSSNASAPTSTCRSAFLLSGSNSATAHRPSPGSSMGALSTGSCRGRSRRSPTWRRHSSAASTA
mmetsp:Transcript_2368/g.7866  ORF Transcript_2368/g.7866 Transcript_2368/m.7866 type:complete len:240 (-) Transcript_2368:4937-5656(-)